MSRASADYEFLSLDDFDEFLADKPRNEWWEMIGGRVVRMMVGARWEHAAIIQNIARHLGNAFNASGSGCRTFTETFYIKERGLDAALLPDVMVVCGDLEPGATATDAPVVLFEVLSPGTEARDRFDQWHVYQRLSTSACRRSATPFSWRATSLMSRRSTALARRGTGCGCSTVSTPCWSCRR